MRRRGIFIELTALLDVILLMLFLVLGQMQSGVRQAEAQAREQTEAARAAADAAEREAASLRRALTSAEEALGRREREELTLGIVAEHSTVLTLSVQEGAARRVRIEQEGEPAFYITFGERRQTGTRLLNVLRELVEQAEEETVFFVFQFDRNAIYHAEYTLLSDVLRDLKANPPAGAALNVIETDITEQGEH